MVCHSGQIPLNWTSQTIGDKYRFQLNHLHRRHCPSLILLLFFCKLQHLVLRICRHFLFFFLSTKDKWTLTTGRSEMVFFHVFNLQFSRTFLTCRTENLESQNMQLYLLFFTWWFFGMKNTDYFYCRILEYYQNIRISFESGWDWWEKTNNERQSLFQKKKKFILTDCLNPSPTLLAQIHPIPRSTNIKYICH